MERGKLKKNIEKSKVFGIGFHKTGTTSLAMALNLLGYHNNRGLRLFRKKWGKEQTLKFLQTKHYKVLMEFIQKFDSCQDNPWYLLYKELDISFPNSKFILTMRDEKKWLESCENFFKEKRKPIHKIIYGVNYFPDNKDIYLKKYQQHNQAVLSYFKDRPNDLLQVNWEEGSGWKEICTFLNQPLINLPFPFLNKSQKRTTY